MKYSLSWIAEFVNLGPLASEPQKLAEVLTNAGLEVEAIEDGAKRFEHVVVGELVEVGKHPNSDRLTLCQVNVGEKTLRQIICGAKNHKKGDKVVAALPGANLPGDFKIKISKIRDVESQGMLCSEKELGFSEESEGILILPIDAPVGVPIAKYLGKSDVLIEVNVTPNRADVLSHYGLAREIAVICGLELRPRKVKFKNSGGASTKSITLEHKATDYCGRFTGRMISGVKVGPSSPAIRSRLESLGINSINNVVDATNYAMLEYGQPLHAYDLRHLKGKTIRVDRSIKGEKFTSFDKTQYTLTGDELTIRNAEGVIGLAGVVGSIDSGISADTTDIYLECAHFLPSVVRRTARRFGIETDAAQRFAKGVDITQLLTTLDRCAELISEVGGGKVAEDFHDSYPQPTKQNPIHIDLNNIKERLGFELSDEKIAALITKTKSEIKKNGTGLEVTPPAYRQDIQIAEDYLEEVARLNGYEAINETAVPMADWPLNHSPDYLNDSLWIRGLARVGFSQSVNYVFLDKAFNDRFELEAKGDNFKISSSALELANPLSDDLKVLRSNLLAGLFRNGLMNYRYGKSSGRLFELGHVFTMIQEPKALERNHLAAIVWGEEDRLFADKKMPCVLQLKEAFTTLIKNLGAAGIEMRPDDLQSKALHPGQRSGIYFQGKSIGVMGALHPEMLEEFKWRTDVAVFELNLEALQSAIRPLKKVKEFSKFPSAEKDFSFLIPLGVPVGELIKIVTKSVGDKLEELRLVDSFSDPAWNGEKISYTLRATFRKSDGSFEDQELASMTQTIRDAVLKARPEVQIR